MSTISCPACAAVVDNSSGACPECGAPFLVAPEVDRRVMQLHAIAIGQKWVLYALLLNLVSQIPIFLLSRPEVFPPAGLALSLVVGVLQIVALSKLGVALKMHIFWIIFSCILLLIPCISLITLMIVNDKATKALQAAGVKVGLMGAKMSTLPPLP